MNLRTFLFSALLGAALFPSSPLLAKEAPPIPAPAPASEASVEKPLSVVRVNVTNQPYDFFRPWNKRAPYQRRAVGPILPGNRVLVTGELVANATYVELEKPDSGEKIPATVEVVDYESNLALLKPASEKFLDGFKPLKVAESKVGESLFIWQLEGNGTLLKTQALLTSADTYRYPADDISLLIYRVTSALQPRDGSFTTPVVNGDDLTGMLLRFDSRTQNADVIPAPVIAHFLKAASSKEGYRGFPRAGLSFSALRDPQLRRHAGISNGKGGVYITHVQNGTPAEKAGIEVGDVLLAVGNHLVDRDGNYADQRYGKVSIVHYLSTHHFHGDKVPFKLLRQGKEVTAEVTLLHPDASKSIIEPYTIDKAPRFAVVGGVVLQELSRQFLREWGADWAKKAPERFVYYDRFQNDLFKDDPRERIVIVTQVLPSPCTIGYEEVSGVVVKEINGVKLKSLADLDAALANPQDGFHRFKFEEHPGEIVLDAREAAELEPELMSNYGLPTLKRLQ